MSNPIDELKSFFISKGHFKHKILECGLLTLKNDTSSAAIAFRNVKDKKAFTDQQLALIEISLSTSIFEKKVENLIEKVLENITTKLDIVADKTFKAEYLAGEVEKINEILHSVIKIHNEFPELHSETMKRCLNLFLPTITPFIQIVIKENIHPDEFIEDVIKTGEILKNIETPKTIFEGLKEDDLLWLCTLKTAKDLSDLVKNIINKNKFPQREQEIERKNQVGGEIGNNDTGKITRFEDLLTDFAKGRDLLPILKKEYNKAGPQEYAIMLFALQELDLIKIDPFKFQNAQLLHSITQKMFGDIGGRYNFSRNISSLNAPSKNLRKKLEIHREKIGNLLL